MSVASQPETTESATRRATPLEADRRSVLISMNPRAGSRSRHEQVAAISDSLADAGYDVRTTTDLGELSSLASEGAGDCTLRTVLAMGGDGTCAVVRNHVPLQIPMLPVPMGTENLLGRHVGQGIDPESVCRTVSEGVSVGLDMGSANGKHFLLMISAGFDAEVIRLLHENRRGNITRRSYFLPTLQTIRSYGYPKMRLYSGDEAASRPHECRWLFGFNLPLYALGLPIAPDALATDGRLDLCAFERGSAWSVLRYYWHVRRQKHVNLSDTSMFRSSRFRIEAPDAPDLVYQIDGDFGGKLPVEVEVLPGDLRLLVSPGAARRLGFALP
jgi:diacylglycerol kinase family enzyme